MTLSQLAPDRKQNIGKTMERIAEIGGTPTPAKTGGATTRQAEVVKLSLKGDALLTNPRWNKVSRSSYHLHVHHQTAPS